MRQVGGAAALSGMTIASGKWTMEVYPGADTNMFTAGDDVEAKVNALRKFIISHGGTLHDITGHWTGSGEDVEFTLPRSAWWPYVWGKLTKGNIAADTAHQISTETNKDARETISYADKKAAARLQEADVRARAATDHASAQAQMNIADADRRAAMRIEQGKNSMLLAAVIAISFAGVVYVTVSD